MSFDKCKVVAGTITGGDLSHIREAVCVQVEKVYDSCREKDCIENAKVLFRNPNIQWLIDRAINVKCRNAEVLDVYADIEAVPFKRGFYTVDVKFFIRVTLDFFVPGGTGPVGTRIVTQNGLVVFDKKVILFGSEGNVKIFKAHYTAGGIDSPIRSRLQQDNLPISKVEVAEPICLNARIEDILDKLFEENICSAEQLPREVADLLGEGEDRFDIGSDAGTRHVDERIPRKRVVVTIGLFSIVKLVRFVQLLIPAFDFCVPNKQCIAATEENPCELFETIAFPTNEFFPPQMFEFPGALEQEQLMLAEQEEHHHHHHHEE